MWDVSAGFSGKIEKERSVSEGGFGNYGANLCLQNILPPLLDSEVNVDYNFDIKHDPIQSDD